MKSSSAFLVLLALLAWCSTPNGLDARPASIQPLSSERATATSSAQFESPTSPYPLTTEPPLPSNMTVTAIRNFERLSPTLHGHAVACPGNMDYCKLGNCCPSGSYCTVDASGNGACCDYGAVCTGLSTPLPALTIASLPASGPASTLKPAKVFGLLGRLVGFNPTSLVSKRSSADLEHLSNNTASDLEDKKGGFRGGGRVGGGSAMGGGATGIESAAPVARPLWLFGIPRAFARHVKTAYIRTDKSNVDTAPKIKFTGPNPGIIKSDQNLTSSASGLPRPSRLFSLPFALVQRVKAAVVPIRGSPSKPVPKLKSMGANPAIIRAQNQTSGGPGRPQMHHVFFYPRALWSQLKLTVRSTQEAAEPVRPGIAPSPISKDALVQARYAPSSSSAFSREI